MRKQKNDAIVLAIGCTKNLMPNSQYIVSDQELISRLRQLDCIDTKDSTGRTYLMYSALNQRYKLVQYLLARHADINAKDNNQYTALHFAAQAGNPTMVQFLIDAGADVNAQDKYGNTPLLRCNNSTPISVFEILLQRGADLSLKNNYGMSALDIFASNDSVISLIQQFRSDRNG